MGKTVIIPDTHNRWEIFEKIVKHESPDLTISLGDAFDDFHDTVNDIQKTAYWFKKSINTPNRIHLVGNHDLHYWFKDSPTTQCGGWDQFKSVAINDIVTSNDWEKLKFFYVLDNKWLLSHAGVHPYWIDPVKTREGIPLNLTLQKLSKKLDGDSEECIIKSRKDDIHWFAMPGFSRCEGSPYHGGLLWCDWNEEFRPITGINQLVGHTPQVGQLTWKFLKEGDPVTHSAPLGVVPKFSKNDSYNLCLDSHPGSRFYAIYENGELTIESISDISD